MTEAADDEKNADSSEGSENRNGLFGNLGQSNDDESTDQQNDDAKEGPTRAGSDLSAYSVDLDKDGPAHDFKVVRFFDLERKKPNTEYLYRFRVWMTDPNNESTAEMVDAGGKGADGDRGRGGTGSGIQGAGGMGSGAGLGGIGSEGGLGDRGGDGRDGGLPPGIPGGGKAGGPTGGRGGSAGDGDAKEEYVETPITDEQKHISVRNRIDQEKKERESNGELKDFVKLIREKENFKIDLAGSRPTEWVEVSVKIPGSKNSLAYAGRITAKEIRNSTGQSVLVGDPDAKILVSDWSNKYGTLVSIYRTVRRGDWLGGKPSKPLHVLHLVDQSIRKLSEYAFQPKQFVVDMMGGEKIPLRSPVEYNMPGEILIMDLENNEFIVRNSLDDKAEMLNRRFQDDESSEYNQRTPHEDQPDDDDGRGGIGGLGGEDGRR